MNGAKFARYGFDLEDGTDVSKFLRLIQEHDWKGKGPLSCCSEYSAMVVAFEHPWDDETKKILDDLFAQCQG